ncbi:MAG: hypothetical protein K8E66_00275 [Phycisphaerales bacterium]|nr:hypothetical protein [Phycisphaerales bacterium]
MRQSMTTTLVGAALAASLLGGCQSVDSTRMTVMNESSSAVLVDIKHVDPVRPVYSDERLDAGAVRAFSVSHPEAGQPTIHVGVRPDGFAIGSAQWLEIASAGPFLIRVFGEATALQFIVSRDETELDVHELPEPRLHRIGAEPPVNPSR